MARTAIGALMSLFPLFGPAAAAQLPDQTAGTGSAVIEVRTEPELTEGTLRFAGTPAGEVSLAPERAARLIAAALPAGTHESILSDIDPTILAAGYDLTEILCDDPQSAEVSTGDPSSRKATFRVEDGETVTCVFELTAASCICPKEGLWSVQNHAGTMACSGTFSMTLPLTPGGGEGTLEIRDGCSTIVASGMSDDEATIVMHANASCGFEGSVGGEEGGIPMTINYTWVVESEERITGDLSSTVSEAGMTCNMSRTYELDAR